MEGPFPLVISSVFDVRKYRFRAYRKAGHVSNSLATNTIAKHGNAHHAAELRSVTNMRFRKCSLHSRPVMKRITNRSMKTKINMFTNIQLIFVVNNGKLIQKITYLADEVNYPGQKKDKHFPAVSLKVCH